MYKIKLKGEMMRFSKTNNIYKIILMSGAPDSILGVSFNENEDEGDIEIIEWSFKNIARRKNRTSKEEVLKYVLRGLKSVNESLGTNYKLSKIYFSPFDDAENYVYSGLTSILIKHYHHGNEFKESGGNGLEEI